MIFMSEQTKVIKQTKEKRVRYRRDVWYLAAEIVDEDGRITPSYNRFCCHALAIAHIGRLDEWFHTDVYAEAFEAMYKDDACAETTRSCLAAAIDQVNDYEVSKYIDHRVFMLLFAAEFYAGRVIK